MFLSWFDQNVRSETIRLPPLLEREIWFVHSHKRLGHLRRPVSFTEKVNWRILNDRRQLLSWTCDKLRMKEEAARYGVSSARVYWSGVDLDDLVTVRLPEAWVLKPNHRSRLAHFGHGPIRTSDLPELKAITHGWVEETQGRLYGEWAYSQSRPCLLVEEMLGDGDSPPPDYKFYVFDGDPYVLNVTTDRWRNNYIRFYTPAWEPLPYDIGYPVGPVEQRPANLDQMLQVASLLGRPFDFMRIDLYSIGGVLYLGEYTPYPTGGMHPYRPRTWDREMGAVWKLPDCT